MFGMSFMNEGIWFIPKGEEIHSFVSFSYLDLENQKQGDLNYHFNNIVQLYPTFIAENLEHSRLLSHSSLRKSNASRKV